MYAHKQGARRSATEQSSLVLLRALSECHPKLDEHVAGVARLAEQVAMHLELPASDVAHVRLAAALHDVGKMAIPAAILEKQGPLSEDDWKFVHRHTLIGARILQAAPDLANVADTVRSSHERYDGTGYPDSLAGAAIPLASRIVFVCDAFDAMTSERPYGAAMTSADALAELQRNAGTQFDPDVVAAFTCVLAQMTAAPERVVTTPTLRLVETLSA
jgi:putative nucleotidyltransferase with HDIG domain